MALTMMVPSSSDRTITLQGQHGADPGLHLHRLKRHHRIAGAENEIVSYIDVELLLHCRSHIDFG